jgi:hypothetical protein
MLVRTARQGMCVMDLVGPESYELGNQVPPELPCHAQLRAELSQGGSVFRLVEQV